jgi:GNAT superfamily N-acetyltransferase
MNYKKFIHQDSMGSPWGIVSAEQLWANVYAIKYNRPEKRLDPQVWRDLIRQAKEAARDFGADSVECRIRLEYEPEVFKTAFTEMGFQRKSRRIEYQQDVQELPQGKGTPLTWKMAQELTWDAQQVAQFTKEITRNALDVDPNEKVEDFIQDWLSHDELTAGLHCIAIGYSQNQPCALTVVQINKETVWSRISYMGLIPSHRGKGLGKWVHRHGFTMMKQQGGKLYHGGTLSNNLPMRKLFESHGCKLFCEMEEWFCNLKGGSDEAKGS